MKGSQRVIDQLQKLLNCELAARDQYFAHSRIYEDMGLNKLYERLSHEMEEETQHADVLVRRILFLEGTPDLSNADDLNVCETVPEMLQADLDVEYYVADLLKETMAICEEEKDYQTRELLQPLLYDTEEDHARWLERQLRMIKMIGIENYLQSQM